jgi:hypothetical protein
LPSAIRMPRLARDSMTGRFREEEKGSP